MTVFSALLAAVTEADGAFRVTITDDWLQGRTAYGGLSAALCVEAALRAYPGLPPLRSAQFALIGPAAGALTMTASILRRGKSAVFVDVDLSGEAGLALRAILSFGVARQSALAYEDLPMAPAKNIAESPAFFPGERPVITFQQHFESRMAGGARPVTPDADPELLIWFRHRDEKSRTGIVPLMALADAPPPAAMILFPGFAPISTMTWSLDMLADEPVTTDGWWLVQSIAQTVRHGYSTQSMMLWNAEGRPVIAARQNVAVFL